MSNILANHAERWLFRFAAPKLHLNSSLRVFMTKHKSADERCEQILDAARHCFLERGYFATKMDDIAKTAGLSKGGVYFHFQSKRDIFRALVEQEYVQAMGSIERLVEEQNDMFEKLMTVGRHFVDHFISSDQPRFMAIIGEMALRDEEIRRMLVRLQDNYVRRIAELLEQGIGDGHLQPIDTEAAAFLLKALIDGVQASLAIGYQPDFDRVVTVAMQIFAHGLQPEGSFRDLSKPVESATN